MTFNFGEFEQKQTNAVNSRFKWNWLYNKIFEYRLIYLFLTTLSEGWYQGIILTCQLSAVNSRTDGREVASGRRDRALDKASVCPTYASFTRGYHKKTEQ